MLSRLGFGDADFSCRGNQQGRTVLKSDFDYRNPEFTSQAIGNRQKRHQRITPIMKWEYQKDTLKFMTKIRTIKPVVDDGPPKRPDMAKIKKYKQEHEQIRLRVIERENNEMLDRLRKIHNRPRSSFCHMKRRGDPLVKGDAFRLPPPSAKGNYLVQMYKKLKLSNPIAARKSIRVQQEMLTSAMDIVKKSNKNQPSEEMVETEVQATLAKQDEMLAEPEPEPEQPSPLEAVQLVAQNIDAKVLDDIVMAMSPTQSDDIVIGVSSTQPDDVVMGVSSTQPNDVVMGVSSTQPDQSSGNEQSLDTNTTGNLEAAPSESSSGIPQSVTTPMETTPSVASGGQENNTSLSQTGAQTEFPKETS